MHSILLHISRGKQGMQRSELVCERGIICHLKVYEKGAFSGTTGT